MFLWSYRQDFNAIEMVEIQEAQNFYISCGYDPK